MTDLGGDPACWLDRVCDDCGAYVDDGGHVCRTVRRVTPAGWYPDPENPSHSRYWNGTAWTSWHRSGPRTSPPSPQYRPLATLARVVIVLLVVYFVLTAVGVVSDWLQLELINRLVEDPAAVTPAELDASDARQGVIAILQVLIYLATGVMFIIWFRRAYRNLEAWDTEGLRFEAGWTVGGWLVPFLNLVRPKQIMNDLWRATGPRSWTR